MYDVQGYGYYWSATEYRSNYAFCLYFNSGITAFSVALLEGEQQKLAILPK
ncbi:MAG: hypothetical protein IIU55_05455 [Paludibacteraceae bacterium]|nr:hypothetical protein [Paludibacteraceae bacterium]